MSSETDSQERQTVRALLPTVSPDTDKLLREIRDRLALIGWTVLLGFSVAAALLLNVLLRMERLIEAQAP